MHTGAVLTVIDAQVGLLEGPTPAYGRREILARIRDLLAQARADNAPIIFVQHDDDPGGPLEPGSPGWQLHPDLPRRVGEPVVRKRACDAFFETSLQREIDAHGCSHLVVAGLQTEYCIDTTCRRAVSLGYDVTLVADAHTTTDSAVLAASQIIAHHNNLLDGFGNDRHAVLVKAACTVTF